MELRDYFTRSSYQSAKSISNYYKIFVVATLSNIEFDAKKLQNKKIFQLII